MGLIHRITLDEPGDLKDGGWVYASLASPPAEFGIPGVPTLQRYAARIPPLTAPRRVFAAVLFPVMDKPPQPLGDFDTLKIEAADYDDGFAQIVHAVQPVSADLLAEDANGIHVQKDLGIRAGRRADPHLANRQVQADLATGARLDAPGVFSYRVDVRTNGAVDGESLSPRAQHGGARVGRAEDRPGRGRRRQRRAGVPVAHQRGPGDAALAARVFLAVVRRVAGIAGPPGRAARPTGAPRPRPLFRWSSSTSSRSRRVGLYEPLLPADTELKYGEEYQFRVRLADLSGRRSSRTRR